ncbi:MAG: hypothetical protein ABI036_01015 [Fibrobacteria bacterium]
MLRTMGVLGLLAAFYGFAADGSASETAAIRLRDGSILRGQIIGRADSVLTIQTGSLGKLTVPEREVMWPRKADTGRALPASQKAAPEDGGERDPSDQALFFMPTAFMPPAQTVNFRDFELLYLTLGYSPSEVTAVTGGLLFPVSPELQVLTFGIKQQLWRHPEGKVALAITANTTKPLGEVADELDWVANANLVVGVRLPDRYGNLENIGFHAAIGYLGALDKDEYSRYDPALGQSEEETRYNWHSGVSFALGAEARLGPHSKFLAEYISAVPFVSDSGIDGGLFTVGIRLHGEHLAADIAGTRPITDSDLSSFFLWPLLVVSYRY